ncbi:MAG TPA: type IX secretion system protein PorQ [Cyclobacteriaceae bacterium]|nr:type IX secretion system protein PorQ [Cyclobacteriaceae bacterium]
MTQKIFLYLFVVFPTSAFAQIGGKHSFEFLNVPGNARLTALGGVNVSLVDRDPNFFYASPVLVGDTLSGWGSAGYQFYVADIGQAVFSYSPTFKKIGTLSIGISNMSYGNMKAYDQTGLEIGDFKSAETVLVVGKSHQVNHFRFGINLKGAFSSIAGYRATALLVDLGGMFIHPNRELTVGLAIKNLGFIVSEYSDTSDSSLPFDVQIGTTFKPEHMPFRFSITAYNLTRADISYYDPTMGNEEPETLDKVLRHFNFGVELLLHRNVNILLGYNYLLHKELRLENAGGSSGLSFGFSARIKSFEFVFSRSSYVVGTAGYNLTLSANLNKIMKRS